GGATSMRCAGPELSLAWKLLWLQSDMHPQSKDLYDATLLAERVQLPLELLRRVFHEREVTLPSPLSADFALEWQIGDWSKFRTEYSSVEGAVRDWQRRLSCALQPTFAQQNLW